MDAGVGFMGGSEVVRRKIIEAYQIFLYTLYATCDFFLYRVYLSVNNCTVYITRQKTEIVNISCFILLFL